MAKYIFSINEPEQYVVITRKETFTKENHVDDDCEELYEDHDLDEMEIFSLDESTFEYTCPANTLRKRLVAVGMEESDDLEKFLTSLEQAH